MKSVTLNGKPIFDAKSGKVLTAGDLIPGTVCWVKIPSGKFTVYTGNRKQRRADAARELKT